MSRIDNQNRTAGLAKAGLGAVAKPETNDAKAKADGAAGFKSIAVPASAQTVQETRQRTAALDAEMRMKLEKAMTTGPEGGLSAEMRAELAGAGHEAEVKEAPVDVPETRPASDADYTKRQLEAMDWVLSGGTVNRSDVARVTENERITKEGKLLDENSIAMPMNLGNSAEMVVIKTPDGEYYKKMLDQPAVKMTKEEVQTLRDNIKKEQHPDNFEKMEDMNTFYNLVWNDLFPNNQVETEGH